MKKSYFRIRVVKDGVSKFCTDVCRFPVHMEFEPATEACQPFQFYVEQEARIFWGLYQKGYPADASGWTAYFEEVFI